MVLNIIAVVNAELNWSLTLINENLKNIIVTWLQNKNGYIEKDLVYLRSILEKVHGIEVPYDQYC